MIQRLLQFDATLEKIFSFSPSKISQHFSLPLPKSTMIYKQINSIQHKSIFEHDKNNIQIITIYDKAYPIQLKTIHDPPLVLYALGDITLVHHIPSISVIGTRNPSYEASQKLNYIVKPLIKHDWLVVSGLAYGIDSLAHQLALQKEGKTISVLGSGFNHIYPRENSNLFHHIVKKGLVLTEYPPDVPPKKHQFPERNRIISGLSQATLVIEAKERSGTLITVEQALDQGREVYAVPGSPCLPQTVGCHKLIQDGAKLVMCAEDILEDWK